MTKTFTGTSSQTDSDRDTASAQSWDEATQQREESRLVDGAAMDSESFTIERHSMSDSASGESGTQGDTRGRENQNPIPNGEGNAASPDGSRGETSGGGASGS